MPELDDKPNPGGRPPYEPTKQSRQTVQSMSAFGIPQREIALCVGIDEKTLRKYYREELDTAGAVATAKVAQNLYNKAIGSDRDAVTAAIFWLKTRGKWRTTDRVEVTGREGGPVETANCTLDWSKIDPGTAQAIIDARVSSDEPET